MTVRTLIQRVAVREYLPLAGLVLTWLAIAATVGHADAVRLLAAVTFVRAAPALTAPATMPLLRKRSLSDQRGQATLVALTVEAIALASTLVALAGIVGLLWWGGQTRLIGLCLLFAPALPVRFIMPLTARRAINSYYRPSVALAGLALASAGLLFGADIYDFAILFAVREWIGLAAAYWLAPLQEPTPEPVRPLSWREIANRSQARGRKVAAYRFSKVFLNAFLGPFGSIAARTGRGFQLDRKLERFVPRHSAALAAAAAGLAAASAIIVLLTREPAFLVAAASLMRMASTAASILIWSRVARGPEDQFPGEDDDDEL